MGGGGCRSRSREVAGADADALGLGARDRLIVASALLHGADVSSSGRAWPTCRVWVKRLMEEFQFQADEVIPLPPSPSPLPVFPFLVLFRS